MLTKLRFNVFCVKPRWDHEFESWGGDKHTGRPHGWFVVTFIITPFFTLINFDWFQVTIFNLIDFDQLWLILISFKQQNRDIKISHLQGLEAAETAKAMSNMVPMMIFLSDGKVSFFFWHLSSTWVIMQILWTQRRYIQHQKDYNVCKSSLVEKFSFHIYSQLSALGARVQILWTKKGKIFLSKITNLILQYLQISDGKVDGTAEIRKSINAKNFRLQILIIQIINI